MSSGGVEGSIYAGLTGIELPEEQMVFTNGIILRKTYAHLTAPFLVSFVKPSKQNPMGTPLKAASGGFDFEITTELVIPPQEGSFSAQHFRVLKEVIAILRLCVSPAIRCPICSAVPYAEAQKQPDTSCRLIPLEIEQRHFHLKVPMGERVDAKYYAWPMANLARILNLIRNHEELRLALSVIDRGQFIENRALTMVSLWGALEALFLTNRGELTFRLAAMIDGLDETISAIHPGATSALAMDQLLGAFEARGTGENKRLYYTGYRMLCEFTHPDYLALASAVTSLDEKIGTVRTHILENAEPSLGLGLMSAVSTLMMSDSERSGLQVNPELIEPLKKVLDRAFDLMAPIQ